MPFYYSLKTDKEEHCLEPRIFGGYDYGIYDLSQNLLKKKVIVTAEEAIEFIYKTQKKLGGKFTKVPLAGSKEEPVQAPPEYFAKKEIPLDEAIEKALKDTGQKVVDSNETVQKYKDGSSAIKKNYSLEPKERTKEEYEADKDVYRLTAELDHKLGIVAISVQSIPSMDSRVACDRGMELVDKLLRSIVQGFPDLVDNYFISAGAKQIGQSYKYFAAGYHASRDIPTKARTQCITTLQEAAETYKEYGEEQAKKI